MSRRSMVSMKFEGGKELEKALFELPQSTAKGAMRRVLLKGAQIIADAGQENAPEHTGALKASYGASTKLTRRQRSLNRKMPRTDVEVYAGPGGDPAAVQTEFGNEHQFAEPHLRPAWHAKREEALRLIAELSWAEVAKTVAKYRKRVARGTAGVRRGIRR